MQSSCFASGGIRRLVRLRPRLRPGSGGEDAPEGLHEGGSGTDGWTQPVARHRRNPMRLPGTHLKWLQPLSSMVLRWCRIPPIQSVYGVLPSSKVFPRSQLKACHVSAQEFVANEIEILTRRADLSQSTHDTHEFMPTTATNQSNRKQPESLSRNLMHCSC